MLDAQGITASYGAGIVLKSVSVDVPAGKTVCVLGPNGAGKTTLLRAISGMLDIRGGSVTLEGRDISRTDIRTRVARGLVHVPEGRELFPGLSVRENLLLGGTTQTRVTQEETLEFVYNYFPRLAERSIQRAGTLSGGEQQMLAIGRGLMAKPKVLLLDEPSFGLAPIIVREIAEIIRNVCKQDGVSVLIVEQNLGLALKVADYGYVLVDGEVRLAGSREELEREGAVSNLYMGAG